MNTRLLIVCNHQVVGGGSFILTYVYPGFTEMQFGVCLANNKRKVSDVVSLVTGMGMGHYAALHKKPPTSWQMAMYEEIIWRTCWMLVMVP